MRRILLKSKIHRARVTDADVDYEGSVTIDAGLMAEADIFPYEKVYLWDVTSGTRLETYAIPGKEGSGVVCVNGAAARLIHKDNIIIIGTFAEYGEEKARSHRPKKILVDPDNQNRILGD